MQDLPSIGNDSFCFYKTLKAKSIKFRENLKDIP